MQIKVGDRIEKVRYFHCYKRGVDRVFVDHPLFLERVYFRSQSTVIVFTNNCTVFELAIEPVMVRLILVLMLEFLNFLRFGVKRAPRSTGLRQGMITWTTNLDSVCFAK